MDYFSNRIGDIVLLMSIASINDFGRWNYINYLHLLKFQLR